MAGWTRGPTIGRGSSATVSLATLHNTGAVFAVKSVAFQDSALLSREYAILSSLSSPHIVRCLGADVTSEAGGQFFNLLMEYFPCGTLCDEIRRRGSRLSEREIRRHASAVLRGLCYLHSIGIVHRDIKGSNLLMGSDGEVRIGDLGCAVMVDDEGAAGGFAGTPLFMAPEVARGQRQGCPADVWALGCTVVEMATGRPPWQDIGDPVSALYRIGCTDMVPEIPENLSEQGKDFLNKCFRRNPTERSTAEELLQHSFFNKFESLVAESKPISESPKSILDHGPWNSVLIERSQMAIASSAVTPAPAAERLRALFSPVEQGPNWSWEKNWLCVRTNMPENFPVRHRIVIGEDSEGLAIASTSGRELDQILEAITSLTLNYVDGNYDEVENDQLYSSKRINTIDSINNVNRKTNLFQPKLVQLSCDLLCVCVCLKKL